MPTDFFDLYVPFTMNEDLKEQELEREMMYSIFNLVSRRLLVNPHQNGQGRKGPAVFKGLMLSSVKKFKKILNSPLGSYLFNEPDFCLIK
jgi:hypothetical protein